jgi:hypothetical protein
MAFKKNGSLMRHDATGAAAFWARWYLERENWELTHKVQDPVRMKVSTDDGPSSDASDPVGLEDTWPAHRHH